MDEVQECGHEGKHLKHKQTQPKNILKAKSILCIIIPVSVFFLIQFWEIHIWFIAKNYMEF